MSLSLQVNSAKWRVALERLRNVTRQNMRAFMTEQFRLLLEQIMAFTPPKDRTQGRKRVVADIARVFRPVDTKETKNARLKEIIASGDYRAFEAVARAAKNGWQARPFDPAVVAAARDNRGRVRRGSRSSFVLGRRDTAALKKFVARKQANVGLARSGWLVALWAVGGRAPSWIINQLQRGQSAVIDRRNAEKPELWAINRTPWANRRDEGQRIISEAMKSRTNRLATALRVQLRLAAKQSGFAA